MLQEPGHRLLSILAEYLWESVSSLTHTNTDSEEAQPNASES